MRYSPARITDHDSGFYERELQYLCRSKYERALKYRNMSDRMLCILGDYEVRRLVSSILGINAEEVSVVPDGRGRPLIAEPADPGLFCSISHSGDIACACVDTCPVGIDIELVRPYDHDVAEAVCSSEELSYIAENGDVGFFRIWTAKESYLKCLGTGLTDLIELQSVEALSTPPGFIRETVEPPPGYVISICRQVRTIK